ncbi:hypothetical protein [Malaciobacter mytili]|uniref:hypothetical protein n=1 Tax=Malaciobacter mytili TaxID=603050 RepID=UPI003A87F275
MPTNQENNSNVKDFLNIDNLQGKTNGVNSPLGMVYNYIGKGSDIGAIFNTDPMIGKTLGFFSNKTAIIDTIDSGINGGYNGFMSSVAGTFSGAGAGMLVASLAPQTKVFSFAVKIASVVIGWEVGNFTKETFLNKEYRQLKFDPYDTTTHKFENGTWYKKSNNGSLTLIEDTNIIDNLNQGAEESKNFNFYKNSTGEIVIEPKNPAFGEYYNIKTNGDIQTVTDNGLTVNTKQTDGVIRVETYSSTEDTKKLTSLTVINPDGTYEYKNKITGSWVRNDSEEYIQTVKTSGEPIKQIIIDKTSGKAIVKTFDGHNWETKEYDSSSEVNKYIKDGGKVEYVDENSSIIETADGGKIVFHNNGNNEEKYVLDKEGNLEIYEIKNEKGEYKKYEDSSLKKIDKKEIENLSNTLNDTTFDKVKLENSIKNIDKSDLQEPSEVGVVSLKAGQTISHIAQNTPFSSIELLEYNNLTLEDAKNLPVGYKVLVPKEPPLEIQGENGVIKLFKNPDDTFTLRVPDENNNKTNITYNHNTDLLIYGDNTNPNKITFTQDGIYEVWEKDSKGIMYQKELSTDEFEISYKMQDGKKVLENIEIKKDNVEIEKNIKFNNRFYDEIKVA